MNPDTNTQQANKLIFLGIVLFLLGLVVGFFIPTMKNPRMALSAHLEGVMNGMFLAIIGLIWNRLVLSSRLLEITFWLIIYSTFANLSAVTLAAITGFGKMMPLAGGKEGSGIIEGLISFLLISLSICMLAACCVILTGFYKYMKLKSHDSIK